MGIMAVLAGITAASYVGVTRRASREGARDNVMGVLRQARVGGRGQRPRLRRTRRAGLPRLAGHRLRHLQHRNRRVALRGGGNAAQ